MICVSKKVVIGLSVVCVLILGFVGFQAFSQDQRDFSRITFSTTRGTFNFFDHASGIVYVYGANGRLLKMWAIDELGKRLLQPRMRESQEY
jgi:hypothetical protein